MMFPEIVTSLRLPIIPLEYSDILLLDIWKTDSSSIWIPTDPVPTTSLEDIMPLLDLSTISRPITIP